MEEPDNGAPAAPPVTLTFLGAAGTVTGSKFLLTVGERRLLVDAGLFQGEKQWRQRNWADFPVPPDTLTDVVLTHAHLDHCGYLPRLVASGFRGPVWCTTGTRDLAAIVLRDAAALAERDASDARRGGWSRHDPPLPLYTVDDVEDTLPLLTAVDHDAELDLGGGITARFTRAGHILGAASVRVTTPTTSVLFSGDLGRRDHPVLRPLETPPGAAYVVVESTYGDRTHPRPANLPHEALADAIRRTVDRGGSVLVPAFAVDRTEVVLRALTQMREEGRIPHVPIHIDSPMGARALAVYLTSPDELRPDVGVEELTRMQDLHVVTSVEGSKALTRGEHGPRIVITSSGMLSGGRAVHHLARMLPDRRNAVVLTGYQAAGTRGRSLLDGASHVKIRGEYVPVRAEVVSEPEFSVHADADELDGWLRSLDPAPHTVFVVHGEPDAARAMARRVRRRLGLSAVVPSYGERVLLAAAPGGAEPVPADEADPSATPVDLDTLLEDHVALLRRHDVSGLVRRYAPDAEIVHAGGVAVGRDAIAALFAAQADLGAEVLHAEVVGRGEDSLAYRARMRQDGEDVDVVGSFVVRDGLIWRQTSVVVDGGRRS